MREKKQQQRNLGKTCYMKKPFCGSKFWDTKRFKRIQKNQEIPLFGKFVTEVLIFRSSRPQSLFLKKLRAFFYHMLLENTYGGCFWIFGTASTFFQLKLVFIFDGRTDSCSALLWKHKLNLRSGHSSCFAKK